MDVFAGDPRAADTDLVIVSAFEGEASALAAWSPPTGGEIDRAIASKEFSGKLFETFLTPIVDRGFRARRLAASDSACRADFTVDRARRVAAAIGLIARQKKIGASLFTADGALESPEMIQAIAEGLTLAEFDARALQDRRLRAVRAARARHHRRERHRQTARGAPRAEDASSASIATWRGNSTTSPGTR